MRQGHRLSGGEQRSAGVFDAFAPVVGAHRVAAHPVWAAPDSPFWPSLRTAFNGATPAAVAAAAETAVAHATREVGDRVRDGRQLADRVDVSGEDLRRADEALGRLLFGLRGVDGRP
jgi:hypothetical protein